MQKLKQLLVALLCVMLGIQPIIGQTKLNPNTQIAWNLFNSHVYLNSFPGATVGDKLIAALAATPANAVIDLQNITGNIPAVVTVSHPVTFLLGGVQTLTCTMPDPGPGSGCFNLNSNNVYFIGTGARESISITADNVHSLENLIWINNGFSGFTFDGFTLDNNEAGKTIPDPAPNFYTCLKTDPINSGVSDVVVNNMNIMHCGDRTVDFRASTNVWISNSRFHHCGINNPNRNVGCEIFSVDAGGQYLNGIGSFNIVGGATGSGYGLTGTTATISAPASGGVQAAATPIVQNGVLQSPVVDTPGNNYVSPPFVQVVGDGRGAQFTASILGSVTSTFTQAQGSGYTSATITFPGANPGGGATVGLTISAGSVLACTVTAGGANYSPQYTGLTFNTTTGFGAFATLQFTSGVLTGCTIVSNGQNYSSSDTATVQTYGGQGATCPAQITSGGVTGCQTGTLVGGSGYLAEVPGVITGDGSGAVVFGIVTFHVSGVTEVNGGYGYTTATLRFLGGGCTSGCATGHASIVNGAVTGMTISNIGTNYYLPNNPAPTVNIVGTGSGAQVIPVQAVQLNLPKNTYISNVQADYYSDSAACARGFNCNLVNVTLHGLPYYGVTPRPTGGGMDMGGCSQCSITNLKVLGANGPQFDFLTLSINNANMNVQNVVMSNSVFDPTATDVGVTPVDISAFDQVGFVAAEFPNTTCNNVNLSNNIYISTRLDIQNCSNVSITGSNFTNINTLAGSLNFAIFMGSLNYVPTQLTEAISINGNIFNTTDGSITYAMESDTTLTGNAPFTFKNNQLNNGIKMTNAGGSASMLPALVYNTDSINMSTLYQSGGNVGNYAPNFWARRADGTQALPSAVIAGDELGSYCLQGFSGVGQGPDGSGFVTGACMRSVAITGASGAVLSSSLDLTVQNPSSPGNQMIAMRIEPGANVSEQPFYMQNASNFGNGILDASALLASDAWDYLLPRASGTVIVGHAGTPTVLGGTGSGSTPPTPTITSNATDTAGTVTVVASAGAVASGASVIALTFNNPYATAPSCSVTPATATAAVAGLFAAPATTTGFTIFNGGTTALTSGTSYSWTWHCTWLK